jgi:peptide/nickel transport system permease protein
MIKFIVQRVLLAIPVLLGVSIIVFATIKIIPGDPVANLAGPGASEQVKDALRQRLGLDRSLPVQYWHWLTSAVRGNLGMSIAHQQPTRSLVADAFQNTLVLTAYATVLALGIGLGLGAVAALKPRSIAGRLCSGISSLALSAPQYSVALIFIIYLALRTGWFPVSGMHEVGDSSLVDLLWHGFLPALTACLVPAGVIARIFRAALLDVLGLDFVEALRARGLSERRVLVHAVHNTLPSLLTVAGLQVGYLLGGVVFVETIFSWPGLGLLLFQSISSRDLPVIQAGVLVSALAFVLINVIVDCVHALLDSRVRTA